MTWDWELRELAGRLELELSADGTPVNPLVVIDLDMWREAPPTAIAAAADLVSGALPVTLGMLNPPRTRELAPLIEALTLTIVDGPRARRSLSPVANALTRAMIMTGDLPGPPSLDDSVAKVREAVEHSPRAAVACGQLVRQTASPNVTAGLAAEAAAYSMLLSGPEFGRWRAERGTPRAVPVPDEPVLVSRNGTSLAITLNVPSRRNAFSTAVREGLLAALQVAEADPSLTSVSLRGAGPAFCSGGDLDEFGTARDLVAAYFVRLARAPWRVIDRISSRVTVYAQGACVGAGCELLAYAGRVVADAEAFFQLPEVRMGLVPGAGGSVSVPRRIGRHRAAWLMLAGERLPAPTALAWGLVDEVA
ncbi:MAG TPA: enoyl-CoA hydratase/isomerase family protein [Trebonia sp.]|nr:enoyl-CoA hydratase/isomerase family protein [Trebonia sp.]